MLRLSKKIISALGLLFVFALTSILGYILYQQGQKSEPAKPSPKTSLKTGSPELGMLAERVYMLANNLPSIEELEEEEQYNREQALALAKYLQDADVAKRLQSTEQLGAYPGSEAARMLSGVLQKDPDPDVRQMAAQTLADFEPELGSIDTLLAALEDPSEIVQNEALLSLEIFLNYTEITELQTHIINGLEKKMQSDSLYAQTRQSLKEMLTDQ